MAEWETIMVEKDPMRVATVTINRPAAFNSFNLKMVQEFAAFWRQVAHDDEVHAVVLRAAPGKAFSPGFDVNGTENVLGSNFVWNKVDPGDGLGPKANRCYKPVIAAVHGICAGGAFYWLNESDIIICEENAQFFDPHVTYGMTSALEPIGARFRMPLGDVLRMVLLGNDERICAQTALRMGFVSEVTKLENLWPRAHELAVKIAQKPTAATQGSLRAIWDTLDMPRRAAMQTGLNYCLLGNPIGEAEVDRAALMAKTKNFEIR